MPVTPIPLRTPFLEVDKGKFTGNVSWPWIKWLQELEAGVPIDPNALFALTIEQAPAVDLAELAGQEAVLASQPSPNTVDKAQVEDISGRMAMVLDDPIPPPVIPAYGGMYMYTLAGGSTTVTVGSSDTWYMISAGFTAMTAMRHMVFQNAKELKILHPGYYHITWSLSVESASANQGLEGSLMLNGTEHTESSGHKEVFGANTSGTMSGTWMGYLAKNDLVQLAVLNHTGANDIIIDHANLSAARISD